MVRKIIKIDQNLCNGCGLCVEACHEGAIGMANGKARLLRDDYCDGLGDCLPVCPTGAISFVEREALAYNEAEVMKGKQHAQPCGCPGSRAESICTADTEDCHDAIGAIPSQLRQWPVQIKLAPVNAPYFQGAHLLIAADCTAYAYGDFHRQFIKNKITLIGCPKLDDTDYSEKLATILKMNDIQSITVVRMSVPCCAGIVRAVQAALEKSGKAVPYQTIVILTDGNLA